MKNNKIQTTIFITVLLGLIITMFILVNPFTWFMPTSFEMVVLAVFSVCFALFLSMYWQERSADERDAVHQMFAGRLAFLLGTSVLSVAIIVQSLQHHLDPWLPVTLVIMILSKYIGRWYANKYM